VAAAKGAVRRVNAQTWVSTRPADPSSAAVDSWWNFVAAGSAFVGYLTAGRGYHTSYLRSAT